MQRTALASAALALLAFLAAQWLTHGFQAWTAEDARRLEVALHPVPAPTLAVEQPGGTTQPLATLLAGEGAVTIADFMYTRCVTVCAALGTAFQQMQLKIADGNAADRATEPGAAPLRLLSISFDAAHDDTAVLARYAAGLRADPALWRFARAARPADAQALLDRYQVTVIPDGLGGYEHNAALLVIDPQGRLVRVFDYEELDLALAYARHLARPAKAP